MLFDFLWNGMKDKIKRKTLCQAFEQGGLKMVNTHEYLSAMKINWLRRMFQPDNCLVKNVLFAVCPAFANTEDSEGNTPILSIGKFRTLFGLKC